MDAPRTFGQRYRAERRLGAGGMGEVFLARDQQAGRLVAIKTVAPSQLEDPGVRQRLLQEAQITARLDHRAIIRLLDHGEDGGALFLVFEYVAGGDLAARLKRGPLALATFRELALRVLAAVAHAHGQGVLHRDIKPSNVFLTERGEPRLADFGIAKAPGAGIRTATGLILGTPAYIAPELVLGQPATAATDQYALGVMFYEMLGGRVPFRNDNPMLLLNAHVREEAVRLSTLRRDVPPDLEEVVHRALAKTPEERWPSVDAFAAALRSGGGTARAARASHKMSAIARTGAAPVRDAPARGRWRGSRAISWWVAGAAVALAVAAAWRLSGSWGEARAPAVIAQSALPGPRTPDEVLRELGKLRPGSGDDLFKEFAKSVPPEFDLLARFAPANRPAMETAAKGAGLDAALDRLQRDPARIVVRRAVELLESSLEWRIKASIFRVLQDLADLEAFGAINGVGTRGPAVLPGVYATGKPVGPWAFRTLADRERREVLATIARARAGVIRTDELISQQVLNRPTFEPGNLTATLDTILPAGDSGQLPGPGGCTGMLCPAFFDKNRKIYDLPELQSATFKHDLDLQAAPGPGGPPWLTAVRNLRPGVDQVELVLVFAASARVRVALKVEDLPPLLFRSPPAPPHWPTGESTAWTAMAIKLDAAAVKESAGKHASLAVQSYPDDYRLRSAREGQLAKLWTATVLALVVRPGS